MTEDEDIRSYSLDELKEMRRQGLDQTRSDAPVYELDEDLWANARIVQPGKMTAITFPLDRDILEWFRAQGQGHLGRMNDALRAYMEAQERR